MNVSTHSQQLNQVLHTHQIFAMSALGGPSLWTAEMAKLAAGAGYKAIFESITDKDIPRPLPYDFKLTHRLPIQPSPFLLTADTQSEQTETFLEGERIACFEIGGEKRLCLPQILKTVLSEFSLPIINQACDDLYIYCSRCNPEQLEQFKRTGVLPVGASTCGLITMTDAERLCAALLHGASKPANTPTSSPVKRHLNETCIPVYHECFGEGHGYLKSNLYCSPNDKCIECGDCGKLLSVQQFVGHSHFNQENRVCHWGFDRTKWRSYLMFASEKITDEAECVRLENAFNDIVGRFSSAISLSSPRKRKEDNPTPVELTKSRRVSDSNLAVDHRLTTPWLISPNLAFSPYNWPVRHILNQDSFSPASNGSSTAKNSPPPALENPESVVPSSETARYEKHFVPNVALQQSEGQVDIKTEKECSDFEQSSNDKCNVSVSSSDANSVENSPIRSTSRSRYSSQLFVLEGLAHMESLYLKVLESSNVSLNEKDNWSQKFTAYSDSIRKYVMTTFT